MRSHSFWQLSLISGTALLSACGGGSAVVVPEETRAQDSRTAFAVSAADAVATTFAPMSTQTTDSIDVSTTSRWAGVLGGAGYRVEVPVNDLYLTASSVEVVYPRPDLPPWGHFEAGSSAGRVVGGKLALTLEPRSGVVLKAA